jgi:hypothetical protein
MQATKRPLIRAVAHVRRCGRALFTPAFACRALRPAAALLVLIGVLAPASLQASFTAPVDLSGDGAFEPQVALDAGGDALAVWKGSDGSFFRVQARARSAAGVLGPLETLSAGGRSAFEPQVAVDADGDALAVWRRRDGIGPCSNFGCFRIQARARSATGTLGAVQTLSPPDQDAIEPQVAVDADGDALVVWRRRDGVGPCSSLGCFRVQARARSAAGVLRPVQTLSAAGQDVFRAQVASDMEGDALAVWERLDGGLRIQARARSAAGTLGPLQTLSAAGQNALDPQVAIDADGDAVVVWRRLDEGAVPGVRVQARARSAAGVLGPVQTLSAAGRSAERPQVAVDADGDALVVWRRGDDGAVQARARSAPGALAPVQTLSPAGQNAVEPQVATEADGDAVAVWGRRDGTGPCSSFGCIRIQARTRSAAGALGLVQTLSAAGQDSGQPQVAAAADAKAVAVWRLGPPEGQGCCARVQAAAGP